MDDQAGLIVVKDKLAVVEMGDGFNEGEAKPGAFRRSAGIEPPEPSHRLGPLLGRNAGAPVADGEPGEGFFLGDGDPDFAARRSVADGIFDQVAHRLRQQLAMPEER